jgi:hypothetical protein
VKRVPIAGFVLSALFAAAALAHRAPNSVVKLEFATDHVVSEVMVPRSELAHALPANEGQAALTRYLLQHVGAETTAGTPWRVEILGVRDSTYVDHEYMLAELNLIPPRGASPRSFVLITDSVTHEVRNHIVWVVDTGSNELLGSLQYPERRLRVDRPAH